jgi:dienelactone hydrolase
VTHVRPFPAVVLAAAAAVALAQVPEWSSVQALPAPTGRFAVGTAIVRFADSSRATSRHISTRPLTVQVWYPARAGGAGSRAPYLAEPGLLDSMVRRGYEDLAESEMRGWASVGVAARIGAQPATPPSRAGWPVLVFSHGLGVARAHYSALVQELASHGYVVLSIDHPIGGFALDATGRLLTPGVDSLHYASRPLANVVRDWAGDAVFVLHRFGRQIELPANSRLGLMLDTTRIGMVGHSIGGASALQACQTYAIVRACADMDGDVFGDVEERGVGKPFLVLLSQPDHSRRPPPKDSADAAQRAAFAQMGRERDSSWAAIRAFTPNVPSYVIKLAGTGHFSFSDAPFQMPHQLRNVGATLSPLAMHTQIADSLESFFDHYLLGRPLRALGPAAVPVR